MRKLYILFLLLTAFRGFAFPPPVIQNPTPLAVCDDNYDGTAVFDLSQKNSEILGSLNSSLYSLAYYETLTDAQNDANALFSINYYNLTPNTQTVYVRVWETANPANYSTTSLQLIVNLLPIANHVPDMVIYQTNSIGIASFTLTDNDAGILNGQTGMAVRYFQNEPDALANNNPIPVLFSNTSNPQTIWATVQNMTTGCYSTTHFNLAVVESGNIYIPDPNFKAQLIAIGTDTNSDGEIQQSEADVITAIYADDLNITDVTGVRSFTNLQTLKFRNNQVSGTLDVSGMSSLIYLDFVDNLVSNVNLSGVNNLTSLIAEGNNLSSVDLSGLTNSLEHLVYNYNNFTTLDLSSLSHLQVLECFYNSLTSLTLGNQPQFNTLMCWGNHIGALNFSGTPALQQLECSNNNLASLDLTANPALTSVAASYNNLTSLTLNGNNLVTYFNCSNNNLSSLDVSGLTALQELACSNNQLTTLDLSNSHHFQYLVCYANQLETLFLKNGAAETFDANNWPENPTLQYICADENQIVDLQQAVGPTVSVNSYCTYTPGGDHNTITGSVHFDGDNNGCDASDYTPPFIRMVISDAAGAGGTTFTNIDSTYAFYTGAGDYTVTPSLENPSFFNVGAPLAVNFPAVDNSISNQHFCITANGVHPDLEIVIAPIVRARPGFEAVYEIVYRNIGNQVLSQANGISLTYDVNKLDFLSADVIPASVDSGTISWDFDNLLPFETRKIYVYVYVHPPTDLTNPVNIDDVLTFNATINPIVVDANPSDNTFQFNQVVVGSFDPNEIVCLEGNVVSPIEIGNYLHYAINFENTGTADAENIVVREVIDTTQFDVSSLQLLNSSSSVTTHVTGNIIEFMFPSINLHSGGHGNILLKIRSNNTLVEGDTVSKKANIYFDYNLPVETAPENTVFQSLSNPDVPVDASISVSPNPTKGNINILCNNTIKSVQLYDLQGRILQTNMINENQTAIDISNQSAGVYFIKIISDNGMKVQKVVRE